ncbi:hypothetical protein Q3G72_021355 [Acer saccharum]|nr:hypothetical protein Q3G72_021355 [Acer saccharum]
MQVSDENAHMLEGIMDQTYEKAKECTKINYYGTKRVTEPLLLLMQLSRSARIVNTTSFYGQLKYIDHKEVKAELENLNSLTVEKLDGIMQLFLREFKENKLEANGRPTTVSAYKVSEAAVKPWFIILKWYRKPYTIFERHWTKQVPVLELLLGAQLAPVFVATVPNGGRRSVSGLRLGLRLRFCSVSSGRWRLLEILTSLPMPGGGEFGKFYSLPALNDPRIDRLPYSIRILLESAIRNCDNFQVTKEDVEKIIDWENTSPKLVEIPFKPARVLLQDFTGVPAVVDLACMRDSMKNLGSDPQKINPLELLVGELEELKPRLQCLARNPLVHAHSHLEMAELEARREQVKLNVAPLKKEEERRAREGSISKNKRVDQSLAEGQKHPVVNCVIMPKSF